MGAEELVSGDGLLSDDSSFYGDEDEQERLLSLCDDFNVEKYWAEPKKELNSMLIASRKMPPLDLHNIYEGWHGAWQLNEPVKDFLQRLPPLNPPESVDDWIWVANPYPGSRDTSGQELLDEEFAPRGLQLLQQSLQERENIRKRNLRTATNKVTKLLKEEADSLNRRITLLAEETNVLAGKWMLFPAMEDLTRVWRTVVEGTISNRLGIAAKVATNQRGDGRLICVYTKDFRDTEDVHRVLKELVALGLVGSGKTIYYKADAYTKLNIYSENAPEYGLQASVYSSQKLLSLAAKAPKPEPKSRKKQTTLDAMFRRSQG